MMRLIRFGTGVLCLGLLTALVGCGGGNTPATGGKGDPTPTIQRLVKTLNDKKLKEETRSGAAISLGQFGAQAEMAIPDLEKIVASEKKQKKLVEQAQKAIAKIRGQ